MRRLIAGLALVAVLLAGAGGAWALSGQLNINTAGAGDIQRLPGIGKSRAQAIVRYRRRLGGFSSLDDLRRTPHLSAAAFQAIAPYLALSGATTLAGDKPASPVARRGTAAPAPVPAIGVQPGEVRLLTDRAYFPALHSLIEHAYGDIEVVMFLFKTTASPRNQANLLAEDLIAARARGVTVSVLLEKSDYDQELNRENTRVGARLAQAGIHVRFDSPNTTTHAKAVVIDHRYCLVGSHNFTGAALEYNHEASLLVDSPSLAGQLLDYMANIQ